MTLTPDETFIDIQDRLAAKFQLTISHWHVPELLFIRDAIYLHFAQQQHDVKLSHWGVECSRFNEEVGDDQIQRVIFCIGDETYRRRPKRTAEIKRMFDKAVYEVQQRPVPLRSVAIPSTWQPALMSTIDWMTSVTHPVGVYAVYPGEEDFTQGSELDFLRRRISNGTIFYPRTVYYTLTEFDVIRKRLLPYFKVKALKRPSREQYQPTTSKKSLRELTQERKQFHSQKP